MPTKSVKKSKNGKVEGQNDPNVVDETTAYSEDNNNNNTPNNSDIPKTKSKTNTENFLSRNKDSHSGFLSYVYSYVLKHGPIPVDPMDQPTHSTKVSTPGVAGVTVPLVRTPTTGNSLSPCHECEQADTSNTPARSTILGPHVQSFHDLNG